MLRLSELSSSEMFPTESYYKKKLWDLYTRGTGGETPSHHVTIQMKSVHISSCRSIAKHTVLWSWNTSSLLKGDNSLFFWRPESSGLNRQNQPLQLCCCGFASKGSPRPAGGSWLLFVAACQKLLLVFSFGVICSGLSETTSSFCFKEWYK